MKHGINRMDKIWAMNRVALPKHANFHINFTAMNVTAKYALCIGFGIVVEVAALYWTILATSIGHGHSALPICFSFVFPYSSLFPDTSTPSTIQSVIGYASLLQMPIYGGIIARGWTTLFFWRYILSLGVVHF